MSTMQLYGSAISIASEDGSLYLSNDGMTMNLSMVYARAGVYLHGTSGIAVDSVCRSGTGSSIAMTVYSVLMLVNQGWMWTTRTLKGIVGGSNDMKYGAGTPG